MLTTRADKSKILSVLEKNRQLLIYDTVYDKHLSYDYALSPFDMNRLQNYTVAMCNRYFNIDTALFNRLWFRRIEVLQIVNKHNYIKTRCDVENTNRNSDGDDEEELVLDEIYKNILKIDNDSESENVVSFNTYRVQLSRPYEVKTPINLKYSYKLRVPVKTVHDNVSLYNFESLAFENRTIFALYADCLFSTYFYQNVLYFLNAQTVKDLENDNKWQAKLSVLLNHTKFSEFVALEAFYSNSVTLHGIVYDTSFVPKYKVRDLKRQTRRTDINLALPTDGLNYKPNSCETFDANTDTISSEYVRGICNSESCEYVKYISDETMFAYRDQIDIKKTQIIPKRYLKIFSIFPFKDGHCVDSNGKIHAVHFNTQSKRIFTSLVATLRQIYRAKNMETAVYECVELYKFKHVLAFVSNNNDLDLQGMGLIVLRAMRGNYIEINDSGKTLRLAYSNEILTWLKRYCYGNKCTNYNYDKNLGNVIIFAHGPDASVEFTNILLTDAYTLIQNISRTARSELDCSIICSRFSINPVLYHSLYNKLKTNAETYAFLTIAIQETNLNAYREYRERLRPVWVGDLSHGELFNTHPSSIILRDVSENEQSLIDTGRVCNVKPTEMQKKFQIPSRQRIDEYEFTDNRLRELVIHGNTILTDSEIITLLTYKLKNKFY